MLNNLEERQFLGCYCPPTLTWGGSEKFTTHFFQGLDVHCSYLISWNVSQLCPRVFLVIVFFSANFVTQSIVQRIRTRYEDSIEITRKEI